MRVAGTVLALVIAAEQPVAASLSKTEIREGWLALFDGQSLFGWTAGDKGRCQPRDGAIRCEGGDYVRTNSQFGDFSLRLEFRAADEAVVYLRVPSDGALTSGHEVRIGKKDSAWHRLNIEAKGRDLHVKVDGQDIGAKAPERTAAGYIALASASEYRNIHLRPLGLEPLYNGANMDGWKLTQPAQPEKKQGRRLLKVIPLPSSEPNAAEWSIRSGAIHVEKGEGQLESTATYDDFLLQMEVRSNGAGGQHPQTAVLIRGEPGKIGSGYEVRIHNQARGANREPANFGTGGLPPFQKARRVVSQEGQFFTQTIAASGRHLSVWIDGQLVTDFEDRRPPGANPEREARLGKGPIAIRAMKESNADFRNIRVRSLAPPAPAAPEQIARAPQPAAAPAPGGGVIPPPAPPPVAQLNAAAPAAPLDPMAAQRLAQQDQQQQQVSQLMQQGLTTSEPEQQVRIYSQILAIDPNNQVAYSARKEAQDKIDQRRAEEAKRQSERTQAEQDAASRDEKKRTALQNAERALLSGDLTTSRAEIEIARRIAPQDPEAQRLLHLVDSRLQLRSRVMHLLFGTSGLGIAAVAIAFVRRFRDRRLVLELTDGRDKGKVFDIADEVTRIGAIAQDGGTRNDVVIEDENHSVSRFHCEIHNVKGRLYIVDRGSSNGTWLDGKRLKPDRPAQVGRNSRIRLGHACTLAVAHRRRS